MDNLDIQLSFRHEAGRAKWRKELFREEPPPFLGPLVTVQEAMELLNRCESYVRKQIDEGRLNCWKDPVSKRVWILKADVDLLKGDIQVLAEKNGRFRGGKRGARKPKVPESESASESEQEDDFEDLDAIGGWEHPKPPPVIGGAAIEESIRESNERYEQKQRENEEWYAAELAKLEDRDPEEAVRQLQIERGWLVLDSPTERESEPESESEPELIPSVFAHVFPSLGKKRGEVTRAISWSNPNHQPPAPVEPYDDPDLAPAPHSDPIIPPFPIGWVSRKTAAAAIQMNPCSLDRLARSGILTRRQCPKTGQHLYDTLELERYAEQQLDKQTRISRPGKRIDWWGSRAKKMELSEFDAWMTVQEAAQLLNVQRSRIYAMCDKGLLPVYQAEPGKRGSKVYVPHHHVLMLAKRPDYIERRKRWEASRNKPSADIEHEDWGIEPHDPRGDSKATRKNHGEYLTTKQTALALGVSTPTVRNLMLRGRLQGHQLRPKKQGSAKNPYWFFKRQDIDALLADPAYIRNSKRGKKAHWLPQNDQ